jgi:tRNA-dihydrouridine synthase
MYTPCNQELVVIANGNITCARDIYRNVEIVSALALTRDVDAPEDQEHPQLPTDIRPGVNDSVPAAQSHHFNVCVMSAEGILRNPSLFLPLTGGGGASPSLRALFQEYCDISSAYAAMGGWDGMDACERDALNRRLEERGDEGGEREVMNDRRCKQVAVAKQHLSWLLGKSGHGRLVRFEHKGVDFRKHTHQLDALKEAQTLDDLMRIAQLSLPDSPIIPLVDDEKL